jgi:hypothetical protein
LLAKNKEKTIKLNTLNCGMRVLLAFILVAASTYIFAQRSISGLVINADSKEPIAGAALYINNTSLQVISNAKGEFVFSNVGNFKGEIITNALGFVFGNTSFDTKQNNLTILLKPKVTTLEAVVLRKPEKDGYKKWGKSFTSLFIGSYNADEVDCTIKNTEVLKFYYDKNAQQLSVSADRPLEIENNWLGYKITYTLEAFEFNHKTRIFTYSGFPSFTALRGNARKEKKWKRNRDFAFENSLLHFMRSLYRNSLHQQGFTLKVGTKVLNSEKHKAKLWMKENIRKSNNELIFTEADSTEYYSKKLNSADSLYAFGEPITSDSIAYAIDSTTAGIYFDKYLYIEYKPMFNSKNDFKAAAAQNIVRLLNPEALQVFSNGSFYNSNNLFIEGGFWAAYEKIFRLLPYDFLYAEKTSLVNDKE